MYNQDKESVASSCNKFLQLLPFVEEKSKSVSGPIFGFCSEHLSVVFRGIGFIRSQTRRNASTSTIAEGNIDITRSIFVHSRQRSTTYRLKRFSSMWSQQFAITVKRIYLQFSIILYQQPGTAFKQCAPCFLEKTSLGCLTVFSEFPPEKPTLNLDVRLR